MSALPPEPRPDAVPAAVRAQLLATEHWSLLATRSLAWSEVMSRITIHLTVASATLVVLALVVQSSGFGTAYHVLSVGLASVLLVLGLLTNARVWNASEEDAALVAGMNRIRSAYVEIDPSLADVLVTSTHDDRAGVLQTTTVGVRRGTFSYVAGGTSMFLIAVNSIVAGTLGALVAQAAGANAAVITVAGVLSGAACVVVLGSFGRRRFAQESYAVRSPTPPA